MMWTSLLWLALGILAGGTLVFARLPVDWLLWPGRRLLCQVLLLLLLLWGGLLCLDSPLLRGGTMQPQGTNPMELALLVKTVNDKQNDLQEERDLLREELEHTELLLANGDKLSSSIQEQIQNLQLAEGSQAVLGPGIRLCIQERSNLMYYDVIDLVNELFLSGAEAVSINGQRFTLRTKIAESPRERTYLQGGQKPYSSQVQYDITIDEQPLSYPLCIEAIGPAGTLEKALDYPGGILNNLATLYGLEPQLSQEEELRIPPVQPLPLRYAQEVTLNRPLQ